MVSLLARKQARVVMKEYGKGKLRSRSGETVTDYKQAQAIAASEQRAVGGMFRMIFIIFCHMVPVFTCRWSTQLRKIARSVK